MAWQGDRPSNRRSYSEVNHGWVPGPSRSNHFYPGHILVAELLVSFDSMT